MKTTDSEALVHRYFDLIARGHEDSWLALFEHEAVVFDPVDGDPIEGHDQLRRRLASLRASGVRYQVDDVFASEDGAAVRWTAESNGTSRSGITIFELSLGGAIRSLWSYQKPHPGGRSIA